MRWMRLKEGQTACTVAGWTPGLSRLVIIPAALVTIVSRAVFKNCREEITPAGSLQMLRRLAAVEWEETL